ncbi:MAG: CYTH and CHAD domain-containing protein [Thiomargarita sp.]|nr:CYTH and CHAD domain-containing protein [Thiomargarita sp.]
MSTEIELKLAIEPKNISKLTQHPLLQAFNYSKISQHLYSTYFDTLDYKLLKDKIGIRVRSIGEKQVQTLKTAGSGLGGLHRRKEWEMEITANKLELDLFPNSALPKWCQKKSALKQINPIFITDFMRTTWDVVLDDDSRIEVALDQGKIKTDSAEVIISEVELELKKGKPEVLYEVARTLYKKVSFQVENKSKAARGYALCQSTPIDFQKATKVNLNKEMTTEQTFINIIQHSINHLQANEDMVLYGKDIEGVHQMRVALRRLRSCLSLYSPLIPEKSYIKIEKKIKHLIKILGVARDLDVLIFNLKEIFLQSVTTPLLEAEMENLQLQVSILKEQAYKDVRKMLHSRCYNGLLLQLGQWITQRYWRKNLNSKQLHQLEQPISSFANKILKSQFNTVQQQGEELIQLNIKQLHELRITIKKLNYGIRFFFELFPHKKAQLFYNQVSELQDIIGNINDSYKASKLLNNINMEKNTAIRHFLYGWNAHQQMIQRIKLDKTWQDFLDRSNFW